MIHIYSLVSERDRVSERRKWREKQRLRDNERFSTCIKALFLHGMSLQQWLQERTSQSSQTLIYGS